MVINDLDKLQFTLENYHNVTIFDYILSFDAKRINGEILETVQSSRLKD